MITLDNRITNRMVKKGKLPKNKMENVGRKVKRASKTGMQLLQKAVKPRI